MSVFGFGFIINDFDDTEIEEVLEDVNSFFGMRAISVIKKGGQAFIYVYETSSKSNSFEIAKKNKEEFHMELTFLHLKIIEMTSNILEESDPEWHLF
jgi:hypothetical protein